MLLDECAAAGVRIETDCAVEQVRREGERFTLATTRGMRGAASLVVASGGLSIPKMGASGYGYELARQFGHRVLPTRAALVPLTLSGRPLEDYAELSGVALPVVVAECEGQSFRAGFLVTHRGLSGPAILQISSYWEPGKPLHLNLLPDLDSAEALAAQQRERPAAELKTVLGEWLPKRLAQRLCELRFGNRPMRQYHPGELREIGGALHHWAVVASGTEGYRTAEVTLGGVDTHELSSATMESRKQPGLYFIGEVVDVTGHLGGFNFQWAWASGYAAGQVV